MSACGAAVLLLVALLAAASGRRNSPEEQDVAEKMSSARCTSRCLTLQLTQLTAAFRHVQTDEVLGWCENHQRCSQCLQPCRDLWENGELLSAKSCEKQTECVTSREFLASLRSTHQGDCPPAQKATGFSAACVESCSSDNHCPAPRKCCSNGCGHTCQAPASIYKGVPLKPRRDVTFLEDSEGQVKVAWLSKCNISMEPIVYLLQSRWNVGIHPSEDHASPWTTVAMTLSEVVVLSDLRPQRWYQFRVAAINSHGSRGFTTPSKHYISSKDPSPPDHPVNVRVVNQTLDWTRPSPGARLSHRSSSRATVKVLVRWDPPRDGDLPVHNYRVTWMSSRAHSTHSSIRAHMHEAQQSRKDSNSRVTSGAQCELWIQGLLPDSSYFLSVQAVAYWGQKRLKSPRAQNPFTTGSTSSRDLTSHRASSSSSSSSSSKGETFSNELPSALPHSSSESSPSGLRLEVTSPRYHDNQLQVQVFWKWSSHGRPLTPGPYVLRWRPQTCSSNKTTAERRTTVQGSHHTIRGLLFACKYRVTVAAEADPGSEAGAWITTPTCSSIRARGGKVPCSSKERPLSGRKVILRPERLAADFHRVNGSLLMTLHWRMSQSALGPAAVEGFRFTWTLLSGPAVGLEDSVLSQTQTIAASQRSVSVHALHPDSVYLLQLQVLPAGGSKGAAVSKTVHTPAASDQRR
ncbi:uncharacterized protein V6R79_009121 [Siganus canaliculatus]